VNRYIGVIDYGMGNLRSVEKALVSVGARVRVISSAREVREAKAIVLPGVGAFGQAVDRLKSKSYSSLFERPSACKSRF
jgi:glutamine amidotransferase